MLYDYEAKDQAGRTVTGSVDAADDRTAAQYVHQMGYFVMRLTPSKAAVSTQQPPSAQPYPPNVAGPNNIPQIQQAQVGSYALDGPSYGQPFYGAIYPHQMRPMTVGRFLMERLVYAIWTGVGLRELALFYRQFATLIGAGVPMLQTLQTLSAQSHNSTLRRCIQMISKSVEAGGTISGSMEEFPWIFRDSHRALISAGELNGTIDQMMIRISSQLEMEYELRATIKRETFQPCITIIVMFLAPPLFYIFLGQTQLYLQAAVYPLLQTIGALFLIWAFCRVASQFKYLYDLVITHIPAIGSAVRMIAFALFARVLATLYSAGITVPVSIRYAAQACGNAYIGKRIEGCIPYMERGYGLVDAIMGTRIFPPMVISMFGTGEQTGSLDHMMNKVAEYYEAETPLKLHQICTSLSTMIFIAIAVRVLLILIKFYSGYFGSMLNLDAILI